MKICAVTNSFNERHNLPIWLAYYGGQIGRRNCVVLDHGSDDDALFGLEDASLIRVPRSEFDDIRRSNAITSLVTSLLAYYDVVIYSDTDEFVVVDPRKYSGLKDFFESSNEDYYTCIGLNIIHNVYLEKPYDSSVPILSQRHWCQFSSPMCKTLATRRPLRWGGGFHSSDVPPKFSDLFLFHLRNADLGEALKRLALTRELVWADPGAGLHQRQENKGLIDLFQAYAHWEQSEVFSEIEEHKATVLKGVHFAAHEGLHYTPLDVQPAKLYRIPEWFDEAF